MPSTPHIIKSRGNTVAHNLCCFHPGHAEAARIIKLLRGARAHNVTFRKQPLSAHPTYSVHITMHFSLSMVLNRSRFLSAHCARIISRIIWLDTGPIQRFRTLAVSIFCVSVLRCLILQSPSFFTLHGSEQVKISVRALCAHNLAHNMAGHGPHSSI